MKPAKIIAGTVFILTTIFGNYYVAKSQNVAQRIGGNSITTAVPFLMIAPDARSGGMGDAGVATAPDANSAHWNTAKYAFIESKTGFAASYTPWLRALVPDINLFYLSGYRKFNDVQAISASARYFSLGHIEFASGRQFSPVEMTFDISYSRKLSNRFSGGISLRYIHSNLTGGYSVPGIETRPGRAFAADITAYYQNSDIKIGGKNAEFTAGAAVTNIGNKIRYTNLEKWDFIPINLRLGPRFTLRLNEYHSISITLDGNKLLVPTPPVYNEEGKIVAGKDPDRDIVNGMFESFIDAPGEPVRGEQGEVLKNPDGSYQIEKGSVFREELREINYASGLKYWYNQRFAVYTGYFWEHATKGNRKFFTLGAGLRWKVLTFDIAYLKPVHFNRANVIQASPLVHTFRFSLAYNFGTFKNEPPGEIRETPKFGACNFPLQRLQTGEMEK